MKNWNNVYRITVSVSSGYDHVKYYAVEKKKSHDIFKEEFVTNEATQKKIDELIGQIRYKAEPRGGLYKAIFYNSKYFQKDLYKQIHKLVFGKKAVIN